MTEHRTVECVSVVWELMIHKAVVFKSVILYPKLETCVKLGFNEPIICCANFTAVILSFSLIELNACRFDD